MYALVYGPEWEDIVYFGDLYKAKFRLVMQTKYGCSNFRPFIQEFILEDGVYKVTNNEWYVMTNTSIDLSCPAPKLITEDYVEQYLDCYIIDYQAS